MEKGFFTRRGLRNVHGDATGMINGQVSPVGVELMANGRIIPSANEGKSYLGTRGKIFHLRQSPPTPK